MTLTDMLNDEMIDPFSEEVDKVKSIFKKWLQNVAVGGDETPETIEMRKMLIILADEP